ncbi:hypothetical protein [Sorangium sp. So ce1182]|uniref:hypothetical protein n=1 Tax=Sorangium sp. So ce1182 TaxID=3133334 RepID=UPI003F61A660
MHSACHGQRSPGEVVTALGPGGADTLPEPDEACRARELSDGLEAGVDPHSAAADLG